MTAREASNLYTKERDEQLAKGLHMPFCMSSTRFVTNHEDLEKAWEACQVPSWMLWWIKEHLEGPTYHSMAYKVRDHLEARFHRYQFHWSNSYPDPQVADEVRRVITYWGELRVPESDLMGSRW